MAAHDPIKIFHLQNFKMLYTAKWCNFYRSLIQGCATTKKILSLVGVFYCRMGETGRFNT